MLRKLVAILAMSFVLTSVLGDVAGAEEADTPSPSPSGQASDDSASTAPTPPVYGLDSFHLQRDASYVHPRPGEAAFELGAAALFYPVTDRELEAGLRFSYLGATGYGYRHSFYLGAEDTIWIFNMFGPGMEVDWVISSAIPRDQYRIEPRVDARLMHVGQNGALALRIGVPYEQGLQWGFRAGLTLQFAGIH